MFVVMRDSNYKFCLFCLLNILCELYVKIYCIIIQIIDFDYKMEKRFMEKKKKRL